MKSEFRDEFFDKAAGFKYDSGNVDLDKALLAGQEILRPER